MNKFNFNKKINQSNLCHERLEGIYNDKKKQLEIKSRKKWLSDKELKQKNTFELKERYHNYVRKSQIVNNRVLSKDERKKIFVSLYNQYWWM